MTSLQAIKNKFFELVLANAYKDQEKLIFIFYIIISTFELCHSEQVQKDAMKNLIRYVSPSIEVSSLT